MISVRVAPDLCCGAGRCVLYAPEVYSLDPEGFNQFVHAAGEHPVPAELEAKARLGARACPECAITIIEA